MVDTLSVTQQEFEKLDQIANGFSKDILSKHPDGLQKFSDNTSVREKINLIYSKSRLALSERFARHANPENHARLLAKYCDAAVPGLVKSFGEADVVQAIADQSPDQRTYNIAQRHGATALADVVKKALDSAPSPVSVQP